jgi:hypothetical protein
MTTSRATALLLVSAVSSVLPAYPQQTQPAASATQATATTQQSKPIAVHATQDKRQILVVSGTLSLLSTREADLIAGDSAGHPVTLIFVCDQNTKKDPASTGDAVNILYVANGPSNLALVIHRIQSSTGTKSSHGEIGGVASVKTQAPAYSLSPSDARSLQKKLEGEFGIVVADTDTKPAYGRMVVLKNHALSASVSGDTTPWNIYVNGIIQADFYGPVKTTTSSSSFKDEPPWSSHGLHRSDVRSAATPEAENPEYVVPPGATLEVVDVAVDRNSVLIKLASEWTVHVVSSRGHSVSTKRVYSILVFPIISNDTPPAYTVEQQIAQFLNPKSTSSYKADGIRADENGSHKSQTAGAPAPTSAASAAEPAPAAPATIAVGQTQKQVIEAFGNPQEISKLFGSREIYIYNNMRITFIQGRVTEIKWVTDIQGRVIDIQ